MANQETIDEIKRRLPEYVNMVTKPDRKAGKNKYICPFYDCQSGGHGGQKSDGAFTVTDDGLSWHCFACGRGGDIFDLIGQCEGLTGFKDELQRAGEIFNIDTENKPAERPQTHENKKADKIPAESKNALKSQNTALQGHITDYSEYYKDCAGHIDDPAALEYLSYRGIGRESAAAFNLGFDPKTGFLIIPCSKNYYVARNTAPDAQRRYNNPAGVPVELFNTAAVYNDGRPVFVTEGAINALAIIEAGGQAVALNSANNYRKLLSMLREKRTTNTFIICLDNDDAGRRAQGELIDGLKDINARYCVENIAGEYNDPDDALTADRKGFIERVAAVERLATRPDNVRDYITEIMDADVEKLRKEADRKTGFVNLDKEIYSLYSGLYVIGGISSVGKTTFAAQLGDQLAASGQDVLYFSMEQSRLEIVSKSISRCSAMLDIDKAKTSLQIRTGAAADDVQAAAKYYLMTVGDRLSVIEGNYGYSVSYIAEYAQDYIRQTGKRPVIVVDYLQVLTADVDPDTGRKPTDPRAIVDANITALKRLSRSLETPVIVVSSVNRSNYLTPIDFESFKESGAIEFTADVVWGLQLTAIHGDVFTKDNKIAEKRESIAQAKEAIPREVELVCLKNRYGKSRYNCVFTYYPQYDYFLPADDGDGFKPMTGDQMSIFD